MSEAVELYKKLEDGSMKATGVFYCSECCAVFQSQEQAANCHGDRFCACGEKIERRFYAICDECQSHKWRQENEAKERSRFEKATKISYVEYQGDMIFADDEYYTDLEDYLDQFPEGQEPEYVWACKDVGVRQATTENIYENLLEGMWEDADVSDLCGVEELEAAVAAFNEANRSVHVYEPDYSTAILIPKKEASNDH